MEFSSRQPRSKPRRINTLAAQNLEGIKMAEQRYSAEQNRVAAEGSYYALIAHGRDMESIRELQREIER